jgi:hypothetical protein
MMDQFIWERRRNLTGLVLELTAANVNTLTVPLFIYVKHLYHCLPSGISILNP